MSASRHTNTVSPQGPGLTALRHSAAAATSREQSLSASVRHRSIDRGQQTRSTLARSPRETTDHQVERQRLAEPMRQFCQRHQHQHRSLLLDGTGPCVTMHLPYLRGAGLSAIKEFDTVRAFSGGVFSYLFFLAYEAGHYRHPMSTYYEYLDQRVRKAHNRQPLQFLRLISNLLRKKPLYDNQYYQDIFHYAFSEEFLNSSLQQVAPNFYPYVAIVDQHQPVPIDEEHGFDRHLITVYDVMLHAMRIPLLYGKGDKDTPYFDANFAPSFRATRKDIIEDDSSATLVMTMWNRDRIAEDYSYVNILSGKSASLRFRSDILSIAFNFPNPRYTADLLRAYN